MRSRSRSRFRVLWIALPLLLAALAYAHEMTVMEVRNGFYPASEHGGNYMHNFYIPPAPSSTPWAPAWAPDGKSVAVSMQGSIWSVDVDGGAARELTYNSRYHSSPAYSPDGKWLVYAADEDHKRIQLEALNIETGETVELTDDDQLYLDPVFSPDGTRLAYVSTKPSGYFNVFVREFQDGRLAGDELAITHDNKFPRNRLYFGPWDMHIEPAWLKNGQELLLVSNQDIPLGSGAIYRVPVKRHGMDEAVKVLDEQSLYRTRPDVSIDGKRIIYSSTVGAADQFHHLYVLPVGGGYPYKMTFGDWEDFHPRWSPDGESIAYISNEGGLPQLVVMETYGGAKKRFPLKDRQFKRPMGRLEVTVLDGDTGKPVHARIQGLASDGKFYTPNDVYSRIGHYGRHAFHTEGSYFADLPPGRFTLQVTKGFEYAPESVQVDVQAGETQPIEVRIRRMVNMNAKGWYSGSTHTHMNYGGNLRNTLENLVVMAKAEDQDIINELVANKDNRVLDWQYWEPGGGEHSLTKSDPDTVLIVSEEYRPPFYGHVFLIGLRDYLISPFVTGYEATGIESLYPSNTDMFRKALAQDAVTGYVHPFSGDADPLLGNLGVAKGFPVDAVLETSQCLEWSGSSRATLHVWHQALNNDIRVTPTGGEDSMSNMHISKLIGGLRTYAYLGKDFTAEAWKQALRDGKTFFTSGPLLDFTIDGKIPGEEIRLPKGGGKIRLQASVTSISPLATVRIYHNGEPMEELLGEDHYRMSYQSTIDVTESGWYSLYVEGPASEYLDINYAQAATNAVRVYVGDQPIRNPKSADYFVRWIDKLHDMADAWPWWRSDAEKKHVFGQFREAQDRYRALGKDAAAPTSE